MYLNKVSSETKTLRIKHISDEWQELFEKKNTQYHANLTIFGGIDCRMSCLRFV